VTKNISKEKQKEEKSKDDLFNCLHESCVLSN